jgi:hypothetical protein
MDDVVETRKLLLNRWAALKNERSSWDSHWRELNDYLLPRSGRFVTQNRNKGEKRHNNILDSTGTRALRILAAGMMAGMTSPARPWFRLTTGTPELDEAPDVKAWLADTSELMRQVFNKSNTYHALHSMYEELGAYGTASNIMTADFDTVMHNYPLTIGEYCLATNYKGRVDTLFREFDLTVAQVVREFGRDKCSSTVRNMWDKGSLEHPVTVVHVIEPRADRDTTKRDNLNMAWKSCYFEAGGDSKDVLRESGYKDFPVLAPRWMAQGGDVYGGSPGMDALGDIKQLQHEQLRKAQVIDFQTKPPLQAPVSLRNRDLDTLPGGITYVDAPAQTAGIRPAFEVGLNLSHLLPDIQDVRQRINAVFYADMFLMLYQADKNGMTATEVAERHEEKLLMLGPVLERLHSEILDPLIDNTFARMVEVGIVPTPPDAIQGMALNVEFVSMLAQAQRAVATNGIDRFVGNLGAVAQFKPDVLDKFDADRWADVYADALGIDPEMIVPGDKVAYIRDQRAQQAQAAQQAAMANQGADTAQKLGSVDTSKQSALTDVAGLFSGYA